MVKVQYNGDISPGRVRVFGAIHHFITGEVKELDEKSAAKLTLNADFVIVESDYKAEEPKSSYKKFKKKVTKEEEGDE